MDNPFDVLRQRREAEEAKRIRLIEHEKEVKARAEEDKNYALELSNQYSGLVIRVLKQLLEAAYPDLEICAYPNFDTWDPEIKPLFQPWRPTWCIGHTQVYPLNDETRTQFVSWDFAVKVSIDFDKYRRPKFVCTAGEKIKACNLSEEELISTLLDLLE